MFGAIRFDGVEDRVEVSDATSLDFGTAAFTISCWIKTSDTSARAPVIVTKMNAGTAAPEKDLGFRLNKISSGGTPANGVQFLIRNGTGFRRVRSNGSVSDGNWHHIVGVRIAAAGANTLLLYVDRVLQIEKADANNINVNNSQPLAVGCHLSTDTALVCFDGVIDEVLVHNVALTPAEIGQLSLPELKGMGDSTQPDNRAMDLRMDNGPIGTSADGVTIDDKSGNGNNGIGDDGSANTGLTFEAGPLSNPGGPIFIIFQEVVAGLSIPVAMHHYRSLRS